MDSHALIAAIARDWSAGAVATVSASLGSACGRCAESDLVVGAASAALAHTALHRLVAPIEEVLDEAVDSYVRGQSPTRAVIEARLQSVDAYRAGLRSQARSIVSAAMERSLATA